MSHRRLRGRPIREVELRIIVEADKGILDALSKSQKEARFSDGALSFTIGGRNPTLVARKARRVVEIIRDVTKDGERV